MLFRIEYDRVVAYHPYRTEQPWDLGGIRLFQVDGFNVPEEQRRHVADYLHQLEGDLCDELNLELERQGKKPNAFRDNHYGFTVEIEERRFQLRFSDSSMYVWLMPDSELERLRGLVEVYEERDRVHREALSRFESAVEARAQALLAERRPEAEVRSEHAKELLLVGWGGRSGADLAWEVAMERAEQNAEMDDGDDW